MTSFGKVFKVMFKQKMRAVWTLIAVNLVGSLLAVITNHQAISQEVINMPKGVPAATDWLLNYGVIFLTIGLFLDFAYFCLSIVYNERINNASTWRLVPFSTEGLLGTNYLTSLLGCIIITVVQFAISALCLLPMFFNKGLMKAIGHIPDFPWGEFIHDMLLYCVVVLLGAILLYGLFSLLNLGGRAIADFLPVRSGRALVFLIRLVLFIAIFYLLSYYGRTFNKITRTSTVGLMIVALLILDIIVVALIWFLLDRFAEPKAQVND